MLKQSVNVYLGDNRVVKVTKIGNVASCFDTFGKKNLVDMKNVFCVEDMHSNFISYSRITENDKVVSRGKMKKIFDNTCTIMTVALKENGLYIMNSNLKRVEFSVNIANNRADNISQKEKWHRLLGHVNFKYLNTLSEEQLLDGIPKELESEFMKCDTYIESKMYYIPFKNNRNRVKDILEIVHTDVYGPFNTAGFKGEYFLFLSSIIIVRLLEFKL